MCLRNTECCVCSPIPIDLLFRNKYILCQYCKQILNVDFREIHQRHCMVKLAVDMMEKKHRSIVENLNAQLVFCAQRMVSQVQSIFHSYEQKIKLMENDFNRSIKQKRKYEEDNESKVTVSSEINSDIESISSKATNQRDSA